ncbi:hypothetical protein ACFQLX_02675 [Streptomyces polyrhachis]|uniref:Uncharacterized protein n=1 Tax=Streptomyces polyrhachis TaxID=1282885 RepID=A0ABW2GBD4_9ACTN
MQPSDDALDEQLDSGERTPVHTTRLGGRDLTGQVQSWQLDRSYATDLPPAMRSFAGSASAQLTVNIGGSGDASAPKLYSPWAAHSTGDMVRPGQSVVHEAGLGTSTRPAFRGTVRSRSAASGTDTVQLTALDGAERLRGPAQLPRPYAGFFLKRPVASATWCVDELLRQAGFHTAPPPRYPDFVAGQPLTLVHASLHGGFAASYGQPESLPDPQHYSWIREGAPHEMAMLPRGQQPGTRGVTASWFPRSRVTVPGSRLLAEAWVNSALGTGDMAEIYFKLNRTGTEAGRLRFAVDFAKGEVIVHSGTWDGGGTYFSWNWPALKDKRGVWHIGVFFDMAGTGSSVYPTVQPRLTGPDGTQLLGTASTFALASGIQPGSELDQVWLFTSVAAENLQVTSGLAAMPTAAEFDRTGAWTKSAELDEAILPLTTVPTVSGSQWDVLTQIAKASMSTAEIDERGAFRWRNHTRFASVPSEADLTLTTVREIASLTVSEEIDACRNYCVQPARDWSAVGAVTGTDYQDTAIREIPANSSLTVNYTMANEEFDISPPLTDDDSVITGGSQVRFSPNYAAGGTAVKGAVDILTRREDGKLVVRFTNRSAQRLYTITRDGKPSVRLITLKPSADPVERSATAWVASSQSVQLYGRQEHSAEASDWIQDLDAAQELATAMREAGKYPVPVFGDVDVLYDPRIQLGDVVRLKDTHGATLDTLAWVVAIRTNAAESGAVQQTLTLRGTSSNGVPADTGLTPDAPVGPAVVPDYATYTEVKTRYVTLAGVAAGGRTWRQIKEDSQ